MAIPPSPPGIPPFRVDRSTGSITGPGLTVTASAPVLDLTQTWNDAGVTFTGLKLNVTATASAAASLLIDLQVGGAVIFSIRKDGAITVASGGAFAFSGRLSFSSSASGLARLTTSNGSSFDSLLLGPSGTTFNRLKHGGTGILQARLADDSAFATIQGLLRCDTNAEAAVGVASTHKLLIYDAAGTAYKVLAIAA